MAIESERMSKAKVTRQEKVLPLLSCAYHSLPKFILDLTARRIEQISGDTDEIVAWRLFDQPTEPVNAVVEIGCQKKLHGFGECSLKVVKMSSIEPYSKISDAIFHGGEQKTCARVLCSRASG